MAISDIPAAKKIRLARIARDMTLRDLSEKVGMHYSLISLFENGRPMEPEQYSKIKAALGFPFDTPEAEAAFSFFLNGGTA